VDSIGLNVSREHLYWIGLNWIHKLMDWIVSGKMVPCPTLARSSVFAITLFACGFAWFGLFCCVVHRPVLCAFQRSSTCTKCEHNRKRYFSKLSASHMLLHSPKRDIF